MDMVKQLKPGGRIITSGGIYGTIMGVQKDQIELKVSANVKIDITKSAVGVILTAKPRPKKPNSLRIFPRIGLMKKGLRWRVLLTLGVMPGDLPFLSPQEKIKLGLDLKGGIHSGPPGHDRGRRDAETDQEIPRLQELFKKNSITFTGLTRRGPGRFAIGGLDARPGRQNQGSSRPVHSRLGLHFRRRPDRLHPEGRRPSNSSRTRPSTRRSRRSATGSTSSESPSR